jgi:hypothetical protein
VAAQTWVVGDLRLGEPDSITIFFIKIFEVKVPKRGEASMPTAVGCRIGNACLTLSRYCLDSTRVHERVPRGRVRSCFAKVSGDGCSALNWARRVLSQTATRIEMNDRNSAESPGSLRNRMFLDL